MKITEEKIIFCLRKQIARNTDNIIKNYLEAAATPINSELTGILNIVKP